MDSADDGIGAGQTGPASGGLWPEGQRAGESSTVKVPSTAVPPDWVQTDRQPVSVTASGRAVQTAPARCHLFGIENFFSGGEPSISEKRRGY